MNIERIELQGLCKCYFADGTVGPANRYYLHFFTPEGREGALYMFFRPEESPPEDWAVWLEANAHKATYRT